MYALIFVKKNKFLHRAEENVLGNATGKNLTLHTKIWTFF